MNDFLIQIKNRGYFFQCTDEVGIFDLLKKDNQTFYLGFDCTGQSLHLGHLVPIMLMRTAKKYGHRAIVLLGGGTTKVGDPSGKDQSRKMLELEQIEKNVQSIKKIIYRFLGDAIFVNNAQWLDQINYLEFLRDIGKHFSINRMLEFESVKTRLQEGSHLSFLEFNYMILQAYDFIELNKRYNCRIQIGGSDQWGNIVSGVELGRKLQHNQLFGLTSPLITTASGKKMGKTESGAVWLDSDMFSPYEYWQYFRNVNDDDVLKFLKLFTELEEHEIEDLVQAQNINDVKKTLATEATKICHGEVAAKNALLAAVKEFEDSDGSSLPAIEVKNGLNITQILKQIGFTQSTAEAKRFIKSGAVKVDDNKIDDINLLPKSGSKISLGKKRVIVQLY